MGGKDKENNSSRTVQAKKLVRPHLNQQKPGVVGHACHPSYMGSINRRISVQIGLILDEF
jgi:hypothetical protein